METWKKPIELALEDAAEDVAKREGFKHGFFIDSKDKENFFSKLRTEKVTDKHSWATEAYNEHYRNKTNTAYVDPHTSKVHRKAESDNKGGFNASARAKATIPVVPTAANVAKEAKKEVTKGTEDEEQSGVTLGLQGGYSSETKRENTTDWKNGPAVVEPHTSITHAHGEYGKSQTRVVHIDANSKIRIYPKAPVKAGAGVGAGGGGGGGALAGGVGGAVAGATVGAVAGSVFPIAGNIAGAIVGGVIGGLGGVFGGGAVGGGVGAAVGAGIGHGVAKNNPAEITAKEIFQKLSHFYEDKNCNEVVCELLENTAYHGKTTEISPDQQ